MLTRRASEREGWRWHGRQGNAAGKGGGERTQWYFQRYVEHLPAGGEIVLFDRSWYNRAGVERVMGFCTGEEHRRFLRHCPVFERMLVEDGLLLRKYWFSVSDVEQQERFRRRLEDPLKRWKLSSVDLDSITRWEAYSRAKDEMMAATDTPESPWYVVESDDKRRARLNMIAHFLDSIAYHDVPPPLTHPPGTPTVDRIHTVTQGTADVRPGPRGSLVTGDWARPPEPSSCSEPVT